MSTNNEQDTTRSNRPSNVHRVMTGQSNGSPINVQVMGCYWRRDDNLLLKSVHEGVDENGGKTEGEQLDECICTVQCTVYCTRIERATQEAENNIKH